MTPTLDARRSLDIALMHAKHGKRVSYEDLAFLLRAAMIADGKDELTDDEAMYVIQSKIPRMLAILNR